ncbi:MAG: autotransporter outer membrane beta-barrel domain-containing protein [Methyloceanibacter sp.]|uniref:autotransporter outer membrane beta-barrel domain-containing protein n=1 Tax=Methyloceanibacter sp. TaxID=1965321 RepID=UPI003D6CFD4C
MAGRPKRAHGTQPQSLPRLARADRKALLLGTALASTLLVGSLLAPTPAAAVVNCPVGTFPPPGPIAIVNPGDSIVCVNVVNRNDGGTGAVIDLETNGNGEFIDLFNSGRLTANDAGDAFGILTVTQGASSPTRIENSAGITATSTGDRAFGILSDSYGSSSPTTIINSGDVRARGAEESYGLRIYTGGTSSPISIVNSGDLSAISANDFAYGIFAHTMGTNSFLSIKNSGDIDAEGILAYGILARTTDDGSAIEIVEKAAITATGIFIADGILAQSYGDNSSISIKNASHITATAGSSAYGISARTFGDSSSISINNSSHITATAGGLYAAGIQAIAFGGNSSISIVNKGDIAAETAFLAYGIRALTFSPGSGIDIVSGGNVTATSYLAAGIVSETYAANSPINLTNKGNVTSTGTLNADGLGARTYGTNSPISIKNSGDVVVTAPVEARGIVAAGAFLPVYNAVTINNSGNVVTKGRYSYGVFAFTAGTPNNPITIVNSGRINAKGRGNGAAFGIFAGTYTPGSPILIQNSGKITGRDAGLHIHAYSNAGATIVNSGQLTAKSLRAIDAHGPGDISIFNTGTITGFVVLDADDKFINQAGGTFEARRRSNFGDGDGLGDNDLFRNERGGTVHTADNPNSTAFTRFVNLERFENKGLISLVDGGTGDVFQISNTVGGTDLDFAASGASTLAVDAFLGGPGSTADNFIIEGNVSGTTAVQVNNLNTGPGVFNPDGIPVVFVTGKTPNPDAFFLPEPISTGFFDYDLFFEPTGSGFWDLRSFPGGGALLLPQLVTAAQDIWHQGSSTWFDRTADLRVLLAGGVAPAYDPSAKYADYAGAPPGPGITPATWVRGSGAWLDRDDTETTTAFGRTYRFDLSRDLEIMDFQMGLDLGKRDLLSPGDILVFGVLGGFVEASLDYNSIVREFDFNGGQVGAYATYLKGGLFVDTLLNAHLYELDANGTLGFPNSDLDASTIGLRTDTGYRFGSFSGGAFLEPLATIEVLWADIDGFSFAGNTVSFDDEANVRGRLGLRAGTTMQAWEGTIMEPFVIGSVWGNFTDDNQATLVSTGTTFRFQDDLDDVWGEVSAGVNFFNPSATTAVFAKVDVTFGDDVEGVGGKAGMRVAW